MKFLTLQIGITIFTFAPPFPIKNFMKKDRNVFELFRFAEIHTYCFTCQE